MVKIIKIIALGAICGIITIIMSTGVVNAHFNFLSPDKWHMEKAEVNEVQVIWGHPYEGLYFDAPLIEESGIIKPDGSKTTLTQSDFEVSDVEGTKVKAFKLSFTPTEKGDYIIYADMEAIVVEEEEIIWEDHVKAIIQYKTTKGWNQPTGQIIEIIPLVRPYGLEEGFVFVGQALYQSKPLAGAHVEIEKYYPIGTAPNPVPDWEPMITRQAITDPNGVFSFTLDEPGIWITAVSVILNSSDNEYDFDKDIRGILMIPVEETYPTLEISSDDRSIDKVNKNEDRIARLTNLTYGALGIGMMGILIAIVSLARKNKN